MTIATSTTLEDIVAGAIFDFAGKVTSGDTEFSGHHDAAPMVQLIESWAAERELSLAAPMVQDWQKHLHNKLLEDAYEQLIWMSGSGDFSPGGPGHEAFVRETRPLMDKIHDYMHGGRR